LPVACAFISVFCHVSIFRRARAEYGKGGVGGCATGGKGTYGQFATKFGDVVAQAVSSSASIGNSLLEFRFTSFGSMLRLL
jgi:hypothetical protein